MLVGQSGSVAHVARTHGRATGGGGLLELPLEALALDRDLAEGPPEEVLGPVAATVASITANRQHEALVFAVAGEHALELL